MVNHPRSTKNIYSLFGAADQKLLDALVETHRYRVFATTFNYPTEDGPKFTISRVVSHLPAVCAGAEFVAVYKKPGVWHVEKSGIVK